MPPWAFVLVLIAALGIFLNLRASRKLEELGEEQRALLAEVLQELGALRGELVASGAVERSAKPPPAPSRPAPAASPSAKPPPLPSVSRKVVSVTRDDHPDHTRATVEAPRPAGILASSDDAPPTQPSESRTMPTSTAPRSLPRPVSFDDQVRRARERMEKPFKVPPELEQRWLARLWSLSAELNVREGGGPTEEQAEIMIRELYQAEADARDERGASVTRPAPSTLASATAPIAQQIAAGARGSDMDGEAMRLWDGAQANDAGRDTGEDRTTIYSGHPGEAEGPVPGLKPLTGRPPHPPPRRIGDPLAGVSAELHTSSATRTADAFRIEDPRHTRVDLGPGAVRGRVPRPAPRVPLQTEVRADKRSGP
jgi:hypothetical protein